MIVMGVFHARKSEASLNGAKHSIEWHSYGYPHGYASDLEWRYTYFGRFSTSSCAIYFIDFDIEKDHDFVELSFGIQQPMRLTGTEAQGKSFYGRCGMYYWEDVLNLRFFTDNHTSTSRGWRAFVTELAN
jgi:hypothetical protein